MIMRSKFRIPDMESREKKIRGITYIYYAYDHKYSSDKHYTIPKNTTIGKCLDVSSETMYPNTNFLKYFPDAEIPVTQVKTDRSVCLRIGAFIVIRKIIAEYHLDEMTYCLIGKDAYSSLIWQRIPLLRKIMPVSTIRIMHTTIHCLHRG